MHTLVDQILVALKRSGLSMEELLQRSGLKLHVTTLRRKLVGDGRKKRMGRRVKLSTEEAEALAQALGEKLVVVPDLTEADAS